ncbi:pectate lyase family protein [Croceivirga lutea]|uniref:pectate lyase family protein n=1 Tax=Croceivirga lutea TaxID=1775167 RepID=UPI00163B19FA|nr:hypothetical protein [Croceivirga lutea]
MSVKTTFYFGILVLLSLASKGCSKDSQEFNTTIQENIEENLRNQESDSVNSSDSSEYDSSEIKAFPDAIGHGRYATGGRGGKVLIVENLNDSGPGSLRAAFEAMGTRNVVVKVAGFIDLKSPISIRYPNMTFEGNTAPGDGIVVRGAQIGIHSSNHIIRNLAIMVGENAPNNADALQIFGGEFEFAENVIVDHCSLSHGTDENLGVSAAKNVTISNTIISNHKGNGGSIVGADYTTYNISFVQNLQIWNDERNPRLQQYGKVEYINNMFYGFVTPAQLSDGCQFDMIGNIWENETNSKQKFIIDMLSEGGELKDETAFIFDNLYDGKKEVDIDTELNKSISTNRILPSDINPIPSTQVRAYIVENVGSRHFSSSGLNSYDASLLSDIVNKVDSNYDTEPYNYPTLTQGEPYLDSDLDGMDDNYEVQKFGDLSQNETTDFDENGYTDLEEFFFFLNKG